MRKIVVPILVAMLSATAIADTPELKFRQMYSRGQEFSALTESLEGQRITMTGFMAPPFKLGGNFFVLTKVPMAVCPFCSSEADWPDDIVFVRTEKEFRPAFFDARSRSKVCCDSVWKSTMRPGS